LIQPLVIDTDVVIDHLRGMEESRKLLEAVEDGRFSAYYSTVTEAEIYSGKKMGEKAERRKVELLLDLMHRVDVNGDVARKAGDLRRRSQVELPNAIIAATALHIRARLVTRNAKHYETIKEVEIRTPEEILVS
jgi:predicted nucleic acid-binding protein